MLEDWMTEIIIHRVPCLSDGAMASLREDLAEVKAGEPLVLAWNYVSKALDEIEWLRERERKLEKLAGTGTGSGDACEECGVDPNIVAERLMQARARVNTLEGEARVHQHAAIDYAKTLLRVAELEGKLAHEIEHYRRRAATWSDAREILNDRVAALERQSERKSLDDAHNPYCTGLDD